MKFQFLFAPFFLIALSAVSSATSASAGAAPKCDQAYPSTSELWPANHKFNSITVKGLSGADVTVQCITQDEPLNSQGDGNTEFDAKGIGSSVAELRAERAGGGNGRVYHINYLATNDYGQCYGQVKVGVPPSKKKAVTDDGELYVSVANPIQCGGEPINKPPVFTSSPILQTRVGTPYIYNIAATDPDGDVVTFALSMSPVGAILDPQSNELQWSPTNDQVGDQALEIVVSDGKGGSSVQSFSIEVLPPENQAPVIQSAPVTQGAVGRLYQYQVVATDADGDTLQYSFLLAPGIEAPAGMTISSSGNIEWTPTVDQKGSYRIWVVVEDGNGGSVEQLFSLTIELINSPPVVTSMPAPQALLGQLYQYSVLANDPDGDVLSYSLSQAPEGMAIDVVTGQVSWTPVVSQVGEHVVEILVEDGRTGSATQLFTLSVVAPNNNPVINSSPVISANVNQVYNYQILATDSDGDTLTYAVSTAPEGAAIDAQTGEVTWLPAAQQLGDNSFHIIVTDGQGGSASQAFTVSVVQPNRAPVITSAPLLSVNENESYAYNVIANDPDGDILTYRLTHAPQNMSVDAASGLLEWLPTATDIGVHNVVIEVVDQENLMVSQTFPLQVLDVNYAPVASNLHFNALEDTPIEVLLLGSDPDGDELNYELVGSVTSGSLMGTAPNLVYQPAQDFFGSAQFAYKVTDSSGLSSTAMVNIDVAAVNDVPVFISTPSYSVNSGQKYEYLVRAVDVEDSELTYSLVSAPAGIFINEFTGRIEWFPSEGDYGAHPILVSAQDKDNAVAFQSFSVIVSHSANNPPTILSQPNVSAVALEAYSYAVNAVDSDGDPLLYSLLNAPEGATIGALSGEIFWVPRVDQTGYQAFVVKVEDNQGASAAQSFSVAVDAGSNQLPVVTSSPKLNAKVGELYSYSIIAFDPDGDQLTYVLLSAPAGMLIDSTSGLMSWAPSESQGAVYPVSVRIFDVHRAYVDHTYNLSVLAANTNRAPNIVSLQKTDAINNSLYSDKVVATDLDKDDLEFDLIRAPQGASISSLSGSVAWQAVQENQNYSLANNPLCKVPAGLLETSDIAEKWHYSAVGARNAPLIVQINDDNQDGVIDSKDIPDAAFIATNSGIYILSGATGEPIKSRNGLSVGNYSHLAAADLDDDSEIEFVAVGRNSEIFLFDTDLTLIWSLKLPNTNPNTVLWGAPSISDINQDGIPEIVYGKYVVSNTGSLIWTGEGNYQGSNHSINTAVNVSLTYAMDITASPGLEIVVGGSLYSSQGELLWENSVAGDGYTAVGNFSGDEAPEIVVVSKGKVSLLNAQGSLVWGPVSLSTGGDGGAPTVADFDGDGELEIGIAGRAAYDVFNADGSLLWTKTVKDTSSHSTGSSVFDFDGNGTAEVVYNDETYLRVFDGRTGDVVFQVLNYSGTAFEYPVIADVDGDGKAEIIVTSDGTSTKGVRVFESASDSWVATRKIWNQHAYHVDNIEDDGAVPQFEQPSYLTHNSFRLNQFPGVDNLALPDLVVEKVILNRLPNQEYSLDVYLKNRGGLESEATSVALFSGESTQALYSVAIPQISGYGSVLVSTPIDITTLSDSDVRIEIFESTNVPECETANNRYRAKLFGAQVKDSFGLTDELYWTVNVKPTMSAPVVQDQATLDVYAGDVFDYAVAAVDADIGDALTFNLASAPTGLMINVSTGVLYWLPTEAQVGPHSFQVVVQDLDGNSAISNITLNVISVVGNNVAPKINSEPLLAINQGDLYQYQVLATDGNAGDVLSFSLIEPPVGMVVSEVTGLIEWTPTSAQVGINWVTVSVSDQSGLHTNQSFVIDVARAGFGNVPPTINSIPNYFAKIGNLYSYNVSATDLDGDVLTYSIVSGPSGMQFVGPTRIEWLPDQAQLGMHFVVIQVQDSYGSAAFQSYSLAASNNSAPVIVTVPNLNLTQGEPFEYRVSAIDSDGDQLVYELESGPAGMVLDTVTGLVQWAPGSELQGMFFVSVVAKDSEGALDRQQFNLSLAPVPIDGAPIIVTASFADGVVGQNYYVKVVATDDGDSLVYAIASNSLNLSIDADGVVQWVPAAGDIGDHTVRVSVSDGNSVTTRDYVFSIFSDPLPLTLQLNISPLVSDVGGQVTLSTIGIGGFDNKQYQIFVNALEQTLVNGSVVYRPDTVGRYDVVATVSDGHQVVTKAATFTARDPLDHTPPKVIIHSPANLLRITSAVDVMATIEDGNLSEYLVYLSPIETPYNKNAPIANGFVQTQNSKIATIDPTGLMNGLYTLTVYAVDFSGQSTVSSSLVLVDGDLKVGNFSITLEDLSVPMSGVPVQVSRTYDSRQKSEKLSFGFGWSVDYQNLRLQESRKPGDGWSLNQYASGPFGLIPRYCVEPNGLPLVTITLPSGDIETFAVEASPRCAQGSPALDVDLVFKATGDTQSTLVARDLASGRYVNGKVADYSSPNVAINPNKYRLTTRAGYVYDIEQSVGIEKITTPNGHTLTYSTDGIVHSNGKSVIFGRDAKGRIETITDPAGNVTRYGYDSRGDLVSVKDPVQLAAGSAGATYAYNNEHGLVDIFDPLGRKLVKNLYDDEGRLYAQEDGDGNQIAFDHDLTGRTSTVTDRENRTTVYGYDDQGNVLAEIRYPQGLVYSDPIQTDYVFDANNNQTSVAVGGIGFAHTAKFNNKNDQLWAQDPLGNRVTYDYNARGQENFIVDERNHRTDMGYDTAGNLLTIQGPEYIDPETGLPVRDSASNVVNSRGLVESTTDMRGHTTHYTYYPAGHEWADQKWTETTGLGGTVTYTYDANNNVKTEARTRTVNSVLTTETVSYTYDKRDRLTVTTYPDGSYTETEYDLAGNAERQRDRMGVWSETDHDAYGRVTEMRYADGSKETNTYTLTGDLFTHTDARGVITRHEYDDFGRIWRVHNDTAGTFTETKYTPQGWVQFQWDEKRNLTEYTYDAAGRRESVIRYGDNNVQQRHSFTYYTNGELHTETDALLHTTTYALNERDQRVSTEFHNGTALATRFDAMGTRVASVDQNSRSTRFGYDDLGRLKEVQPQVQIDGVDVPITAYGYDEVGNKLSQTDTNSHTTRWTYDYFGRVLTRTLPAMQQESFVYDDLARTISHTDFNGQLTFTQLDVMGRAERVDYHDGSSEAYTYFDGGLVETVTNADGISRYSYDARGALATDTRPDGTVLRYQYDPVGNRTQVKVTRNGVDQITDYTYDAYNRLATTTDTSGVTHYGYDAVGNLDTVTYPNGLVTDYDYNSVNQLERVSTWDANGQLLGGYTYTLDSTGRRELITEDSGRMTDYVYDNLYRLTDEIVTDDINGNYSANYQYDWVGNRTYETVDGVQTAYVYDDNDRLETQGGTSYSHDDNGNRLTETLDGATTVYHYNAKNQLASLDKAGVSTSYRYNANGIRTGKTEAGISTDFIVDENRDYAQVLQEIVDGNVQVSYTYGHDLINQTRNTQTYFYHYDGLGSTRGLSDAAGTLTDSYNYEAFGEVLNQTGDTENSYLFTGEQFDRGLDQYYLRARYYDQGVGRFTQMDTWMGNPGRPITLNKYAYADLNPAGNVDPSGHMSIGSQMAAVNIQGTLSTLSVRVNYLMKAYDTAQAVSGLFDFASAVRQVMGQAMSINPADTSRSGVPGGVNFQDAIESATYNFPKAIASGVGDWGKGYSTSSKRHKLKSFLIYMPLLTPGSGGSIPIKTPAKVRFGKDKVPVKLVFGGPGGASGTLFGLGMEMGKKRQLVRMDYHRFNPGHGGASGLKNDELSVWRDGNFHYHVRKWHQ